MQFKLIFLITIFLAGTAAAQNKAGFKGQEPIKAQSTVTQPIQKQWKGVFNETGDQVFFRNDFPGARLNGVAKLNDSTYNILITAENTPINGSPWYAFKAWSSNQKNISIKFSYPKGVRHRYNAKLSKDGKVWTDKSNASFIKSSADSNYVLRLSVGPDTTWIAAQELVTSADVASWIRTLESNKFITSSAVGTTREGRSIPKMTIGNTGSKNRIVITGRNHPPEVTGHYALQAFVETLCSDSKLAKEFRKKFLIYVIPLLNPDGVDEGHWRHNAGGIDLNRDWSEFNQPESRAVRDFLITEIGDQNKLLFGIDFHSTFDDIYYTVDPALKGNIPGFIPRWLDQVKVSIPGYIPHVKPLYFKPPTFTEFSYLFEKFGTESLVYEIGDNTPKDFIVKKGQVSAEDFMRMMIKAVR
jgi:hypothetical protein